jgi:hypothetical protein
MEEGRIKAMMNRSHQGVGKSIVNTGKYPPIKRHGQRLTLSTLASYGAVLVPPCQPHPKQLCPSS